LIRLAVFGFTVGFAFMCFGYEGSAGLATRALPFALIGTFSGVCAIALGAVACGVAALIRPRPRKTTDGVAGDPASSRSNESDVQ
jgi:hypothetical protein